jgi:putative transposase
LEVPLSLAKAFKPMVSPDASTGAVLTAYDAVAMSAHSYSRCWIHLIWGTLHREKLLSETAAAHVSHYLTKYIESKGVHMRINCVNPDHVHALVDLPTSLSIEELAHLLKGSSSHWWIKSNDIILGKFAWGRGYGAFSLSESNGDQVDISHTRKNIIAYGRSQRN